MATQKKPTKKNNSTKSKKNTKKSTKKTTTIADSTKKQGVVFATFIFAIFMAAVTFIEAGGIWGHLRNFFFGIFGWSAFFWHCLSGTCPAVFCCIWRKKYGEAAKSSFISPKSTL